MAGTGMLGSPGFWPQININLPDWIFLSFHWDVLVSVKLSFRYSLEGFVLFLMRQSLAIVALAGL